MLGLLTCALLAVGKRGGQNGLLLARLFPLPDATQISRIEDGKSIKCSDGVLCSPQPMGWDSDPAASQLVRYGAGPSTKRKVSPSVFQLSILSILLTDVPERTAHTPPTPAGNILSDEWPAPEFEGVVPLVATVHMKTRIREATEEDWQDMWWPCYMAFLTVSNTVDNQLAV